SKRSRPCAVGAKNAASQRLEDACEPVRGRLEFARLVDGDLDDIRREIDVNYFGALHVVRAFAPAMRERGRGAFLNVSSVMAWLGYEHSNSYGASKAANWAMSNGLREELAGAGIQVSSSCSAAPTRT